jgi:predicted RNase H-like HicB family nuclease
MTQRFTAIIEREDDDYVALCPELDIASQGESVAEARNNLKEAIELFLETASTDEIQCRLHQWKWTSTPLTATNQTATELSLL